MKKEKKKRQARIRLTSEEATAIATRALRERLGKDRPLEAPAKLRSDGMWVVLFSTQDAEERKWFVMDPAVFLGLVDDASGQVSIPQAL